MKMGSPHVPTLFGVVVIVVVGFALYHFTLGRKKS